MTLDIFPTDDSINVYLARFYHGQLRVAQRMESPSLHDAACHFHASVLFAKAIQDTMTRGMTKEERRVFLKSNGLNTPSFVELCINRNGLSHESIPYSTVPNPDVTVHGSHAQAGVIREVEPGHVEHHLRFQGSLSTPMRADEA